MQSSDFFGQREREREREGEREREREREEGGRIFTCIFSCSRA